MKFGTLQGVLGEPLPDVFAAAKALGFDGVELDWGRAEQAQEGGTLDGERRAGIRAAAEAAGVEISSVASHFLNGGIASPNDDLVSFGLEQIREGIALCRDLGAKALLVPFFGDAEIETDDQVNQTVRNLRELAPHAEEAGVTLAIEHSLPAATVVEILEAVGSTHVGDYWDMGNAMCFGYDPVEEVKTLGRHLARVHAKEYVKGDHDPSTRRKGQYPGLNVKPFGEGEVPVREVLAALSGIGYDGYVTLETGAFGERKEAAKAALDVLRSG